MALLNILLAIVVSASMDSTTLTIGDQTTLHLTATYDNTDSVSFPQYEKFITDGVEVISQTTATRQLKGGKQESTHDIVLTAFADSLFFIPPQPIVSNTGDTILTESFALNIVQPFVLDTTNAITDIKPQATAPVWIGEVVPWVGLGIGMLLLGGLVWLTIYLIRKHRKSQPDEEPKKEIIQRPAKEWALEQLDRIKEEKKWQKGEEKVYFTDLTDVIREYIQLRYSVSTLELTSSEILSELQPLLRAKDQQELYAELKRVLTLSDLVKFAKWHPLQDESESSLRSAYRFVNETSPKENHEPLNQ